MTSNVIYGMLVAVFLSEGFVAQAKPIGIVTPICHTDGPKYTIAEQHAFLGDPQTYGNSVKGCDGKFPCHTVPRLHNPGIFPAG